MPPSSPSSDSWTTSRQQGCPHCGFVSPRDPQQIVAALRGIPLRYEAAIGVRGAHGRRRKTGPGSGDQWSPWDYVQHVRDSFIGFADQLGCVQTPSTVQTPSKPVRMAPDDDALMQPVTLAASARRLVSTIEAIQADQWDQVLRVGNSAVTALDLAGWALHEGVHHLRDLEVAADHLTDAENPAEHVGRASHGVQGLQLDLALRPLDSRYGPPG